LVGSSYKVIGEGKLWQYLEGIDRLGGYMNVKNDKFNEEVEHWVRKQEKPKWFMDDFKKALKRLIPMLSQNRSIEYISPKEYLSNVENWITPGSTRIKLGEYEGLKIPRTKTMLGHFGNQAELYSLMQSATPSVGLAIPKRETSKIRPVIASDIGTYFKMDYVFKYIEEDIAGSELSTLFMSRKQQLSMWFYLSKRLPEVTFPLDQGNFDQNISADMIIAVLNALRDFYVPRFPFLARWFGLIVHAIKTGYVKTLDEIKFLWQGGVLSGWRITAILDTIINLAQLIACMIRMGEQDIQGAITLLVAQGDDDEIRLDRAGTADYILNYYNEAGFEANPTKMFVSDTKYRSKSRDDFLRINIFWDRCIGPPARGINSVLWADPSKRMLPRGLDRVQSTIASWQLLASRGCDLDKVKKYMVKDLKGLLDWSEAKVMDLLETPKSVGGMGVFPDFNRKRWLSLDYEIEHTLDKRVSVPEYLRKFWRRDKKIWISELGDWGKPLTTTIAREKYTDANYSSMTNYSMKGGGVDLVPRWKKTVPTLHREQFLSDLLKEEKITGIDQIRYLIDNVGDYDYVRKQARKSVFIEWLYGKIDYKSGSIWGIGQDTVDLANLDTARRIWGSLLRRGNANMFHLKRSYWFYEEWTIRNTLSWMNHFMWRKSD
jgi:hypothetical protein